MKVTVNGKEYHIHFAYQHTPVDVVCRMSGEVPLTEQVTTHCHMHEGSCGNIPGRCEVPALLEGKSTCHENDQFVKSTGRKIAMSRALKNLSREVRTEFWLGYFALSPKSKV